MTAVNISVRTGVSTEFIDITERIREEVLRSGIRNGICVVFIPHTTAGVTINEAADPDVRHDMLKELNRIIPFDDEYRHSEGNSAAHIKATVTGSSVTVPIGNGKLLLGTWQGIYLCEFDGPRQRTVNISVIG